MLNSSGAFLHCVNFMEQVRKKNRSITLTPSSFILSLVVKYATCEYKHASHAAVRQQSFMKLQVLHFSEWLVCSSFKGTYSIILK